MHPDAPPEKHGTYYAAFRGEKRLTAWDRRKDKIWKEGQRLARELRCDVKIMRASLPANTETVSN